MVAKKKKTRARNAAAKPNPRKNTAAKKKASKKRSVPKRKRRKKRIRGRASSVELVSYERRGLGARTGGQSGDTQGLSGIAQMDSESVEELLEEGQSFEAEVVAGVENAPDADESEIITREVPEDDVPEEYRERD
jgi:hypothetical protein